MLKIAQQTIHSSDGAAVATEVLARLQLGDTVLSPPRFMAGKSMASWFALDIEVLHMLQASTAQLHSPLLVFMNISAAPSTKTEFSHVGYD